MRPLTTADVARRPLPGATVPTSIRFSPDGRVVTHLLAEPGSLVQSLVVVDVDTGASRVIPPPGDVVDEASLGLEERLRRERGRELAVGVTRYQWADDADRVLVPMADGLWLLEGVAGGDDHPRLTVPAARVDGPILDARLSADGRRVGFVAGDEVHVAEVDGGEPVQVTTGAADTGRTNGLAEYVAQEEMGRPYGFWLSPDAELVAFCEVDETHIPVFRIVHQGSEAVGDGAQEDHRYPFAGEANAHVRVGVVPADGRGATSPRWLDLDASDIGPDRYVARVDWVDGDALVVQLQSRDQCRLDVVRYDLDGGAGTPVRGALLWTERSDIWINLHDVLRPLPDGSLLWASERTGFRHLEVREPDGTVRHVLTEGSWAVTDVVGVGPDEVWFRSTADRGAASPLDRHVHRVPLDGSAPPEQLTEGAGVHGGVAHPASGAWVHTWSTPAAPPRTVLRTPERTHPVHDAAHDPRVGELGLIAPELRTIETEPLAAGGPPTELHAAVYRPDGDGPFPTVVWVYGGPHVQLVTRSWGLTVAMRAQLLRQEGFCVAVVDGRGSADRGLAFEGALRHRMGTVEVEDQVRLIHALVAEGTADPARVGIYGWSYGGFLSAMCLARRPDVFGAACAGAPVTAWDGYDTHYTERYMGTPAQNPDGYRDGSVMAHVEGMRDRDLLLVHGLIDENVHFRHTARLLHALVRADIDHRLLLYPDERHVPRHQADRESMEHRIVEFFRDALAEGSTDRRITR